MSMKVSFEGIGDMIATFPAADDVVKGWVVKLDEDGQVCACGDGDRFVGTAVNVREGFAGVRLGGLARVGCSGAVPGCGWVKLAADGKGGVKSDSSGQEYLAVAADASAETIVIRL